MKGDAIAKLHFVHWRTASGNEDATGVLFSGTADQFFERFPAALQKIASRAAAHGNSDGFCRHTSPTSGLPTHTAAPEPLQPPTASIAASPTSNTRRRVRIR